VRPFGAPWSIVILIFLLLFGCVVRKKIFLSFSLRLLLTHALITVIVFSRRGLRSEKNLHWIGFLPSTFSIYKSQPVSLYPMCLLRLEKIQPFALVMDGSKCALLPLACHFSLVALLWTVVDVRPFGAPSLSLSPLVASFDKKNLSPLSSSSSLMRSQLLPFLFPSRLSLWSPQ
jgi:hypothetical protein